MYAASAYLERVGRPRTLEDLKRIDFIAFDRTDMMIDGLRALGAEVERRQFPVVTSNHLVQWELCKRGVGVCVMMEEVGDAESAVERVLPELVSPFPVPMWIVCHRELRTSRRIRLVFDRLAEGLATPRRELNEQGRL